MKPKSFMFAVLLLPATVAGCADDGRSPAGAPGAPKVAVTPGDGSRAVRPDRPITVTAAGGVLTKVSVRSAGREAAGTFTTDRSSWRTSAGLVPGASYQVTATATGAGAKTTTLTSRFRTLKSAASFGIADITPMGEDRERIGVGSPIIVTFNRAVVNRAVVERRLEVRAERPVPGAWRWISDKQVVYRTRTYWRAHQKVRFTAHLTGVPAADGVYGSSDVSRRFAIGAAQISVVDTRRHRMTVRRDGRVLRTIPISAGSGGMVRDNVDVFLTASGVHLVMDRKRIEHMDSRWMGVDPRDAAGGGYAEDIPWAVRISGSGEYVHQSGAAGLPYLGVSNRSHGCVRATPAGARWFYTIAQRGDVVNVTGTARRLPWTNGWSYWQLGWNAWRGGSD